MTNNRSVSEQHSQPAAPADPRGVIGFMLLLLVIPAVLFGCAGTLAWPMGWAYTTVTVGISAASRIVLLKLHPDLIRERSGQHSAEGVQEWDRTLMPLVSLVGPLVAIAVSGLNYRFSWPPPVPVAVQVAALLVLALSLLFATWAMVCNPFFSAIVRIQTDRGHSVVSAGPYSLIRHPAYAASLVTDVAGPLALGTLWALLPGLVLAGLTILRTSREDRALVAHLPGYAGYAQSVRFRLFPGLW
jgi:protein-S-isoprenylcysteine O-methyltransferase Ste14